MRIRSCQGTRDATLALASCLFAAACGATTTTAAGDTASAQDIAVAADGATAGSGDSAATSDSPAPLDTTPPADMAVVTDVASPDTTPSLDGDAKAQDTAPGDVAPTDVVSSDAAAPVDAVADTSAPGGCTVGLKECGDTAYCATPKGTCAMAGTCAPRPLDCPKEDAPVCACGGVTWPNACSAAQMAVNLASDGPCAAPPPCALGDDSTCPANHYCQGPIAKCSGAGICAPTYEGDCPSPAGPEMPPVCGCDGKTYANDCEVMKAGTNTAFFGACEGPQPCESFTPPMPGYKPCPTGTSCVFPNNACGGEFGECKAPPASCTKELKVVCGCDGNTYDNACLAQMAGTGVSYVGSCPVKCDVGDNAKCSSSMFCSGPCGQKGTCAYKPDWVTGCPPNQSSVCGCDGKTYSSACKANMAGVSIADFKPCK